jgi:hypothetical protein
MAWISRIQSLHATRSIADARAVLKSRIPAADSLHFIHFLSVCIHLDLNDEDICLVAQKLIEMLFLVDGTSQFIIHHCDFMYKHIHIYKHNIHINTCRLSLYQTHPHLRSQPARCCSRKKIR